MSDSFVGEIRIFAGVREPSGWVWCNGQALGIDEYSQALYTLIGTTYGGDPSPEQNYFCVPDLRGRIPIGAGQGGGLSPRTIGDMGGTPTITLTEAQLPQHNHGVVATLADATSTTPGPSMMFAKTAPNVLPYADTSKPVGAPRNFTSATISRVGGAAIQPHENMMPTMSMNFIICVIAGVFPTA
jgi:microcystin-dependent protein